MFTFRFTSFLLFPLLLFGTGVNSSLMLLLCVFVKCSSERDCPGRGGPLTACEISRGGLDSVKNDEISFHGIVYPTRYFYH